MKSLFNLFHKRAHTTTTQAPNVSVLRSNDVIIGAMLDSNPQATAATHDSTPEIENLVFSGGGAAGYAYAGAIEALENEPTFSFDNLKSIAGTSIGALAALIISLKYTPQQASNLLNKVDLKKFSDGGNYIKKKKRVINEYGKFEGKQLVEFIKEIIKQKTGIQHPEMLTFADLKSMGCLDLHVIANKVCNINGIPGLKEIIFSFATTPSTSVVSAVHASAAAPWYFSCVKMKEVEKEHYVHYVEDKNGFEFIDGGLINNYPIEIFDKPRYLELLSDSKERITNPHTLGLILLLDSQIKPSINKPIIKPVDSKKGFIGALLNGLLSSTEREKLDNPEHKERTIQINRLDVQLADFNVDDKTKERLMQSGRNAVINYFVDKAATLNKEILKKRTG